MVELTTSGRALIEALIAGPVAWRSPVRLAGATGLGLEETTDHLADLDAGGWLAAWERPGRPGGHALGRGRLRARPPTRRVRPGPGAPVGPAVRARAVAASGLGLFRGERAAMLDWWSTPGPRPTGSSSGPRRPRPAPAMLAGPVGPAARRVPPPARRSWSGPASRPGPVPPPPRADLSRLPSRASSARRCTASAATVGGSIIGSSPGRFGRSPLVGISRPGPGRPIAIGRPAGPSVRPADSSRPRPIARPVASLDECQSPEPSPGLPARESRPWPIAARRAASSPRSAETPPNDATRTRTGRDPPRFAPVHEAGPGDLRHLGQAVSANGAAPPLESGWIASLAPRWEPDTR